jgi:RNA polymerase sigma-70 factor (ECF subfamily)
MNDRQAEYERLIAPIERRMMRSVWRIVRDAGEAEEAFQEALLKIWKRWERILEHPNPEALVLQICVNAAHDRLRRSVRQNQRVEPCDLPELIPDEAATAQERLEAAEREAGVLRAIGQLSKNQARAILLHAVEEVPYEQIARTMECRESTVRKHVERARKRLRGMLAPLMPGLIEEEKSHA